MARRQAFKESLVFSSADVSVGVGLITGPQVWARKQAG